MIEFEQVREVADHNLEYLMYLLPKAQHRDNELLCANIMGDKGEAFSYNIKSGLWSCFATGTAGNGVIDLICAREGCSAKEAADIVNADLEYANNMAGREEQQAAPKVIKYVVAPPRSFPKYYYDKKGNNIDFEFRWPYKNKDNETIAYDCRYDTPEGKVIKHFLYNRSGDRWYECMVPENRSLYNLPSIYANPEASIIISEGCKTADALQKYFPNYVCVTWQGNPDTHTLTDWSPVFGRKVIIVPDADKLGRKVADQIADHLRQHGTYVRIVNTQQMETLKSGWDFADALASGMEQKDVIDFFKKNIYEFLAIADTSRDNIIDPEVVIKESKPKVTYDDSYFRCLGVQADTHYFYKKQTSQIIEFKPSGYDSKHLINLAPLNWWQMNYPQRKEGVDWMTATDDLCRLQEKIGIFDNTKIRGRGAWFDNGRTVLHLGNILFTDGKLVDIDDFDSEYFYEKAPSLAVKVQTSLPKADSNNLLKLCRMARWDNPAHGDILAGWMFTALVCGAMPFRSHLYLIGAAGTGKSWMLDNVVKRVMGNIALSVSSKSTEAGIRDQLGGDIRPVIFDEAEAENNSDKVRMQSVFDLARNGSSEKADAIVKFGAKYVCRSAFLFASINSSMSKTADLSRTAFIKLANAPVKKSAEAKAEDNAKFRELEAFASRLLTDEYCRCLLSRAISLVPTLRKSHKIIADLAAKEFGSRRLGDQMAMIIAGIWGLQSDTPISEANARKLIEYTCLQSDKADADDQTQEERCLDTMLFSTIETQTRSGVKKYMLNLLVSVMNGSEIVDGIEQSTVKQDLASKGVTLGNIGARQYMFLSVNKAALPSKLYKDTEWEFGWQDALLRIEEVEKTANKYFAPTLISRAIAVPLNLVIKENASVLT